jgi:hypothetical protein
MSLPRISVNGKLGIHPQIYEQIYLFTKELSFKAKSKKQKAKSKKLLLSP